MLKHGGKLHAAALEYDIPLEQWLDLSTGINPNGWVPPEIPNNIWNRLPEDQDGLLTSAAHYYGCSTLLATAGSQASIQLLPQCLVDTLDQTKAIGIISPGYTEHAHAWKNAGYNIKAVSVEDILSLDDAALDCLSALVIINPNNPTGTAFTKEELLLLHQTLIKNKSYLIVDEAFIDSTPENSLLSECPQQGLIVLRSLGKFFGLAGIRAGFIFSEQFILDQLQEKLGPWSISNPSRYIAAQALADYPWHEKTRLQLPTLSTRLSALLNQYGLTTDGGTTLFQWVKTKEAETLHHKLAEQAIFSRLFTEPDSSIRFGLPANETEWQQLEKALSTLKLTTTTVKNETKTKLKPIAKTLMVQGTTSDAGKSILVTGLCRVLKRLDYKVVPFKPQNMALNSCVSVDGGEIGRAQALQAAACGLEPHSHMNPVLLKPNSDIGAQVIIHGKAIGNMKAKQYQDFKAQARKAVLASHQHLEENYNTIIVEGAGSPAEINLRRGDIANMGFAESVDCPVILVADIDRGGVFAHLVGTLELLSPTEKARIKGFVINRFRGDIKLLEPGLDWLEEKTGKPVLGVLPYLKDLFLDAEDSIDQRQVTNQEKSVLNIVVPQLPRISNHNDFDPLRHHPQVNLQFIPINQTPPPCDLIILPGSKSVRDDLAQLKQHQWPEIIEKHLRYGGKVMGICGGFQMLGKQLHDPLGMEGKAGSSDGLALLKIETTLEKEKQLKQVCGLLVKSQAALSGYEIHAGKTTGADLAKPVVILDGGRTDGACSADNQIIGTYLHGIFEMATAMDSILDWAGLKTTDSSTDYNNIRNQAIDRLADSIEMHLDMDRIIEFIEDS